VNELKVTQRY